MLSFKSLRMMALWIAIMTLGLTACQGLAGEPQIIGTIPPPSTSEPITASQLNVPDNVNVALGAEIYAARCTDCHGATGAGDGPLVLSGQVPAIVDFNDPTTITDVTPQDYFLIITNGILDKLMPPWANALSESERWAVTMYVYGLSGGEPDALITVDESLTDTEPPVVTTEEAFIAEEDVAITTTADQEGLVVRGSLIHGTANGVLPIGQSIILHIMDAQPGENTYTTTIGEDGSFVFSDIPAVLDTGYLVAVNYQDGYFLSDMGVLNSGQTEMNLDITIYESTNEPSALHISNIVYQIEAFQGGLEIGQYMVLTNISDRVFVNPPEEDEGTPRTSLSLALPEQAVFSPWANDPQRYLVAEDGRSVYDTRAILPGTQQMVQLIYSIEGSGQINFQQPMNYPLVAPIEIYAGDRAVNILADSVEPATQQQFGDRMFNRWLVASNRDQVSFTIDYDPSRSAPVTTLAGASEASDTFPLGIVLMFLGGGTLGIAGVMYLQTRATSGSEQTLESVTLEQEIGILIKQIAEVDVQHKNGQLSDEEYEKQRPELKARLSRLMQQKAQNQQP